LDLPSRAFYACKNWDINTVGELRRKSDCDLLALPNFGRVSLRAVRAVAPYAGPFPPPEEQVAWLKKQIERCKMLLARYETELAAFERFK